MRYATCWKTLNKKKKETNLFRPGFMLFLILATGMLNLLQAQESVSWREAQRQEKGWYGSEEAIRVADNVLLYQNDNGGWLKNIDMAKELGEEEKAELREKKSKKSGTTIDNGATHTQLRYLAKVFKQTGKDVYKEAFLNGVDYLLKAQYENGGWPQFYPIREGYYEHITYNDRAMIGVMDLLRDMVREEEPYDFVPENYVQKSKMALEKGLEIILDTQIRIDGKPTLWCAQHHKEDLSPATARSYELPSLSGSESVGIVKYLMEVEDPDEEVKEAVRGAVEWFKNNKITGKKVMFIENDSLPGGRDRVVVEDEGAGPLWGRFNEIGSGRPMFVGRDGVVKNKLHEIEQERRIGYSYIGSYAEDLLKMEYPEWEKKNIE